MDSLFLIDDGPINLNKVMDFIFSRKNFTSIQLGERSKQKVENSFHHLINILENNIPVYGVTTGFGDSCNRVIPQEGREKLQENLISYLLCGTGDYLDYTVSKAILLLRIISLSKGNSGVSPSLLDHMIKFANKGWYPLIPREGSLGASGDLVPLAYLGNILRGQGKVLTEKGIVLTSELLNENNISPYRYGPKEGLAIVNGTSAMAALSIVNFNFAKMLIEMAHICTAWLCIVIKGRDEAFGDLVNKTAKCHKGQTKSASTIKNLLEEELHSTLPYEQINIENELTQQMVQDPYSLRCSPQILGPIIETLDLIETWLENEINSVSDNPLIDDEGNLATGGNFYGGHLAHGMDYLKICLGNLADHLDRQLTLLVNSKTNRGLPDNLVFTNGLNKEEKHLHHGLKGLHQCVSALTSEIMALSIPNGIFSRSSESHNQDKISLGMSSATQCSDLIEKVYSILSCHLICLAQALDLREIKLKGTSSKKLYSLIRKCVPFITKDTQLDKEISDLKNHLKEKALKNNTDFNF